MVQSTKQLHCTSSITSMLLLEKKKRVDKPHACLVKRKCKPVVLLCPCVLLSEVLPPHFWSQEYASGRTNRILCRGDQSILDLCSGCLKMSNGSQELKWRNSTGTGCWHGGYLKPSTDKRHCLYRPIGSTSASDSTPINYLPVLLKTDTQHQV